MSAGGLPPMAGLATASLVPSMRASFRTALVVFLSIALLALFLRHADLGQVWFEIGRSRPDLVLLALVAIATTYVFRTVRWQFLLAPVGTVRFSTAFRTTVIGFAASALLPARAGEVLRPYLLARKEGLSATAAFATILLERILDLLMVLLLFGAFLLFSEAGAGRGDPESYARLQFGGLLVGLGCVAALVVMAGVAGRPDRLARIERALLRPLPAGLARRAAGLAHAFAAGLLIVRQPGRLALAILLSLPVWLSIAVSVWGVSHAFHIDLTWLGTFLMIALLVIGVAVPTPAGVGGFHYFYRLGAVSFFDAPNDRAVGAAIVLHAVSFLPVAVVGLVFLAQEGLSLTSVDRIARSRRTEEAL